MAYTRVAAKLTTDNPIRYGYITKHGGGRDWEAAEMRSYEAGAQFQSADVWGTYSWLYGGDFEYLKPLKGIAPISKTRRANMALTDWSVIHGAWQASPSSGYLTTTYLHFHDARPNLFATNEYGLIESSATFAPSVKLWMWRFPGDPADADPATVEVQFMGDGAIPSYVVGFPVKDLSGTYWQDLTGESAQLMQGPYLMGAPLGCSQFQMIDQANGAGQAQKVAEAGTGAEFMSATIEFVDGWFLCRTSMSEQPWAFRGSWDAADGRRLPFEMRTGKLRIAVIGHTAMVAVAQMTYASGVSLHHSTYLAVNPANTETTPSYRTVSGGSGTVSVAPEYAGIGDRSRPVVTFSASSATQRAVLYNVQEYRAATIGGAVSAPQTSIGDDSFKLYQLEGELTDKWRGNTLTATIKAKAGSQVDELKPNRWVQAAVGANNAGSAVTYYTLFTGWYGEIEKQRDPAEGPTDRSVATLQAFDGIEGRLSHHQMLYHCSYEGWPVGDAFRQILNRCGVSAAQIVVAAACETMTLPLALLRGDRRFQFRPEEQVVAALDMIAECRDLQWGYSETGAYFIRPRPTYAGTYGYTLTPASLTPEDHVLTVKGSVDPSKFCTALWLFTGRGADMKSSVTWDLPAQGTASALNYIGDYWPRVEIRPEYDETSLTLLASRLWAERTERLRMIAWTMQDHPELLPDSFVKVQVPNIDIPTDSIYRIIHKRWTADPVSTRFSQELVAVLVQEGT